MTQRASSWIRTEEASSHAMQTAEVDAYDGQGRFATFLVRGDAEAMATLLHVAQVFTQYVAKPDEVCELRIAHDEAERVLRRFERRLNGGCISLASTRCPTCGDVEAVRMENIGNCVDSWHRNSVEARP
jgi:hypothetical protein